MRDRDVLFLGMLLGAGVVIFLEILILIFYQTVKFLFLYFTN